MSKKINLNDVFFTISEPMRTTLTYFSKSVQHPSSKGDVSEYQWVEWLKTYLPKRYQVGKGFVIDSLSNISEQQDIIIYDNQYTPYLLNKDGLIYVPSESVYAVIEIKPTLNKKYLDYAGNKIFTVRNLIRKAGKIRTIEGYREYKEFYDIIGGFVCLDSDWKYGVNEKKIKTILKKYHDNNKIDIICCLNHGSLTIDYNIDEINIETSNKENALIYFFIKLINRLQLLGTAPPINFEEYFKQLNLK